MIDKVTKEEAEKLLDEIERITDIRRLTVAYEHMLRFEGEMRPGNEELYDKIKNAIRERGDYLCSFASKQGTKMLKSRDDRLAGLTCSVMVGPMGIEVAYGGDYFEPTKEEGEVLDEIAKTVTEIITYQRKGELQ